MDAQQRPARIVIAELSGSVLRLAAGTKRVDGATACLDKSDLDKLGDAVLGALQRAK